MSSTPKPRCGNCHFWGGDAIGGSCRRNPPMVVADYDSDIQQIVARTRFPWTNNDDWCGQWRQGGLVYKEWDPEELLAILRGKPPTI